MCERERERERRGKGNLLEPVEDRRRAESLADVVDALHERGRHGARDLGQHVEDLDVAHLLQHVRGILELEQQVLGVPVLRQVLRLARVDDKYLFDRPLRAWHLSVAEDYFLHRHLLRDDLVLIHNLLLDDHLFNDSRWRVRWARRLLHGKDCRHKTLALPVRLQLLIFCGKHAPELGELKVFRLDRQLHRVKLSGQSFDLALELLSLGESLIVRS